MSTTVVAEFLARPGHGDDVVGLTRWTERHNHTDYPARRTAHGFTATFEAIPTQPLVLHYYDEVFQSEEIAAGNHRTELTPGANHALDEARASARVARPPHILGDLSFSSPSEARAGAPIG